MADAIPHLVPVPPVPFLPPPAPPVVVLPPGYPPRPVGGRIYVSQQDDHWDMIAIRVYGRQRGNEHLMFRLLEANYHIMEFVRFPAGVAVNVPDIAVQTVIPLVPWKSSTVGTTTS